VAGYNDGIVNILHLLPEDVRVRVNRERAEGALAGLTERERMAIEIRLVLRERGDDVREHRGEARDDLDGSDETFQKKLQKGG